ncbi:MAG: putrescine aminotransferase [Sulfobacillus benefaciens]|uniref:Putrescine aminotransferase n=1 Tax=Sulfobacillus benefaciens TaxID=453960 RepID=A0A2T2XDD3_9FIRM|nr:MAG: putrescine aminotransferase [Sulfobacillus benefaciens]
MSEDLLTRYEQYMNPALARIFRFTGIEAVEDHGKGALLWDEAGNQYLDCAGGYGVFVQGYQHPRIVARAKAQLDKLALSSRVLESRPAIDLAEKLAHLTPGDLQYSFFCNSGAEAVEGALKFARAATGRSKIVSTHGAFHGKTFGALSVSGRPTYQEPFLPLLPNVERVPYGDIAALRQAVDSNTAAVIVEPIQGEGGIIVPADDYLPELRHLCDAHGALLIADEVQTGIARTGKLFAVEHSQVVPDLLCLAKALGGGIMPIGAIVGRPKAWTFFEHSPLIHTSTFGGNPLACAVAVEALDVTVEEQLPERAAHLGAYFLQQLQLLRARYPLAIREARGRGLMIGLELAAPGVGGALISALFQRKVLAVYTLNNERVIRLMPPLVITQEQLDEVLNRLNDALKEIYADIQDLLE